MAKYFFLLTLSFLYFKVLAQKDHAIRVPEAKSATAPFFHGVASGDPLADAVIIWTRVTPAIFGQPVDVQWEFATDIAMQNTLASGTYTAMDTSDYTVKIDVTGLSADTYYYFRFQALGAYSITGRTKTAPDAYRDQMRFGVVSCSDYRRGYFIPYRNMAERNDLEAIIHLGDYIYEGGGGPTDRLHEPDEEIYQLQHYRTRFSQYHLDQDLSRCHQVYPWITIWDDHDIVVDALTDTSYRHEAIFGNYSDRKYAAIKAAREWLPMRDIDPQNIYKNWRKLSYGDLVDLFMVDVRLYDRDRFANDAADTIYGHPNAKILGPEQLAWLNSELENSTARWKVIANQLMVGQFNAVNNDPLVYENWDGYPVERSAFFDNLENNSIDNVVFLTGDFHCSFALDLSRNPRDIFVYNPFNGSGSLAVEFIVPSVTGDNFDEGNDFGLPSAGFAEFLINTANPHIKYSDLEEHGYILLDLNLDRAQAEFWHMEDILDENNSGESLSEMWYTENTGNHVVQASTVSDPLTGIPTAPPFEVYSVGLETMDSEVQSLLNLYPLPASAMLLMDINSPISGKEKLTLIDEKGTEVFTETISLQAGFNHIELDVNNLSAGSYFLMIGGKSYKVIID